VRTAVALALLLAPSVVAAQTPGDPCADPRTRALRCFGYLFVGDGARRSPVVVDGRDAGRAPLLLQLDPRRAHTVRVRGSPRRVRVAPRRIVEVERDAATDAARGVASDADLATLRARAPLGYASVVQPDTCGGPWIVPLRPALPIHPAVALSLWEELETAAVRRVVPRAEELVERDVAVCRRGDVTACDDVARAILALADRVPGMSAARAFALWRFACDERHSAAACDSLGRELRGEAGQALLQRACAEGFAESCSTLAIQFESRTLLDLPDHRPTDLAEARTLFARACALGHVSCCLARDRLAREAPPHAPQETLRRPVRP
jgi:hypothetical protein